MCRDYFSQNVCKGAAGAILHAAAHGADYNAPFPFLFAVLMPRFYCPQPLAAGTVADLPETVAHHLHVVRMQPGEALTLFDGRGGQYRATLLEVGKKRASAAVEEHAPVEAELPYPITLAQ